MFSFHKPKIYRSNLGCCICKAKSSSSRFTDSKKYENEFEHCFRLKEKRSGEICNACVLLVKRWKKLSHENRMTKHWNHVVDARAGPGTKLTGNKRLTSPSSHNRSSPNNSNESNESSTSGSRQNRTANRGSTDVLPLSSNQVNNQSNTAGSSGRSRSLSKVCAIDTNVSTFTFGEPIANVNRTRRYMSNEANYYSSTVASATASSSHATLASSYSFKPQSALNSSAFESVIKRFRQRQQQQHLEAQRRQQNRQDRAQQRNRNKRKEAHDGSPSLSPSSSSNQSSSQSAANNSGSSSNDQGKIIESKRAQRFSTSENSLSLATVLDSSIWRREKICCGVIFRGLYNEIAIVPRLLKPCQCRSSANPREQTEDDDLMNAVAEEVLLNEEDESDEQAPPPRATKSGSISSCDSNTSGCGSMEEINSGSSVGLQVGKDPIRRARGAIVEGPRKRQRLGDGKQQLNVRSPSGSSSGNSSSQLVPDDDEEARTEALLIDGGLILAEGDASTSDSSNDASSSSVESIASAELGGKQSNAVAFG